jgi:hypothetical protein
VRKPEAEKSRATVPLRKRRKPLQLLNVSLLGARTGTYFIYSRPFFRIVFAYS